MEIKFLHKDIKQPDVKITLKTLKKRQKQDLLKFEF